jgi:hypothetical protein
MSAMDCSSQMRRRVTTLMLSVVAAFAAALCASAKAAATASEVHVPIVITPSSGCGLLTAYTAGPGVPAWSGPPPTCGAGAFTLGFNQGSTAPPTTLPSTGVATAGSALLSAWLATGVPEGARVGYRITAPPGITIDNVVYDDSRLQNIANGRGWIGLIYWNGGPRRCIRTGPRSTRPFPVRHRPLTTGGLSCDVSNLRARGQRRSS